MQLSVSTLFKGKAEVIVEYQRSYYDSAISGMTFPYSHRY